MIKITEFENEDALDLLADIIEPAAIIMADPEVQKLSKDNSPKIKMVSEIIRNHKKEAIEVVAALHREKPDKYRFNLITLVKDILDILNDESIQAVFLSQSQNTGDESSGSATENTEAESE